ncbi:beta-1,3-galactosyltransferase 5-like [Pomacea canaliculata]|nr:beta-1,3-galactosyltransferase 5-like [Pomacea canaliculata]XP_025109151.1 beta-1,3-galactosyltransferase 5-like [Pomacea canaliculata]XP_025109152.1 beta-1,3-galactosyltransferase 5-like [Pomacea canaliculata]XP_025109154.1 beta-1,3-galactosyltransferase 5-like [Pomacea canaliculata]XP_025109155.1 beta-1,3-galactosyltransferase 5-like [Pomacea canaliculata]
MTQRMPWVKSWLGWLIAWDTESQVLVTVYVENAMQPHRLSRHARRVLLTTSIWSVLLLVFIFFFTYTVLLIFIRQPLQEENFSAVFPGSSPWSSGHSRQRIKLLGRDFGEGIFGRNLSDNPAAFFDGAHGRRTVWNAEQLYDTGAAIPKCQHGSMFLIIITSSPDHFEHRQEIRKSWCNPELSNDKVNAWQCVFLIGQTSIPEINTRLKRESELHHDILRGSYLDSYRNLTHKVMHGLSWVAAKCEAPYVLKTDDDCFVNTHLLLQFLLHHNPQTSRLYAGNMLLDSSRRKVIRKPNEKWSVPEKDYLPDYYPVYASGSGYALSFDVVSEAVKESHFIKPIPNEDAYIGIVMDHLKIKPTISGRFTLSSNGLRLCNYLYIFVAHGVSPQMHKEMHANMMTAESKCNDDDEINTWY